MSARPGTAGPLTRAAGLACVAALSVLRMLPVGAAEGILRPLLPLYPLIRPGHARRLQACFAASPFSERLETGSYYRTRLRLLLQGLKMHGVAPPGRHPGYPRMRIEGESIYARTAGSGRPLALIGLHAGLFELLHRIPGVPEGRPFQILTAEAFSPPLTDFMARGRESGGKKILWVGGERERGLERGLRSIAAANGVLALMADQHPGGAGKVEYLRLWDRIAVPYPARLLRFLASRNFVLLPVSTRVEGNGDVHFRFHSAWNEVTKPDASHNGPELGECVRGFLEEAIAAAPEQWNWSYPKVVPAAR